VSEYNTLAALQAENARLIALLESHGIDRHLPPMSASSGHEPVSPRLSPDEKVAYSASCFVGARMYTPSVGKAKHQVNLVTHRLVTMNGAQVSAINRTSSVATAVTAARI
jgi:hypothetical protein